MILQNDSRIKTEWIHKEGCATLSVLWYLNKKKRLPMSPPLIDKYFERLSDQGCYNRNMELDWRMGFKVFGVPVHLSFEKPDYKMKPGEFAIGEWYNPRTKFTHFTAVDGVPKHYVCTYDPLGKSVTVREGFLKSLRVFWEGNR